MVRKSGQDNPLRSRILIAAPKVITPNCMGTLAAPRASFNSIKKSSNPARGSLIIGLCQFQTATDTKHSAVRPIQFFQWPVIIFSPTMPQRVVLALLVYDMFFFMPLLAFSSGPGPSQSNSVCPRSRSSSILFRFRFVRWQDKLEQKTKALTTATIRKMF